MQEMEDLRVKGLNIANIQLSTKAHLIFEYHKMADAMHESSTGTGVKLGTTKRGIGPAYSDKAARTGIRAGQIADLAGLEKEFRTQAQIYNEIFTEHGIALLDIEQAWSKVKIAAIFLKPFLADTVLSVNRAIKANKNILCEGAQGALLDIDHGTYPFVTSSNTTSGGACTGAGIAPRHIASVWGVMKAYTTRVGEGPFPTELNDTTGQELRRIGNEFGATTGRPRRCGWFDAVASSFSCMINGVDKLAITKMDVLDTLPELKICTAYEVDGIVSSDMPSDTDALLRAKPIYETMPGWQCSTAGVRNYAQLPENARKYLERIAGLVSADIAIISVGPKREQTFLR
jgi:adenylosuccinate synthase